MLVIKLIVKRNFGRNVSAHDLSKFSLKGARLHEFSHLLKLTVF